MGLSHSWEPALWSDILGICSAALQKQIQAPSGHWGQGKENVLSTIMCQALWCFNAFYLLVPSPPSEWCVLSSRSREWVCNLPKALQLVRSTWDENSCPGWRVPLTGPPGRPDGSPLSNAACSEHGALCDGAGGVWWEPPRRPLLRSRNPDSQEPQDPTGS